jgi:heme A synthase
MDGQHTHGDGEGGFGMALLVFLVAIIAAAAITPIVTAITVLIHVLAIAVPAALVAVVALGAWRVKSGRPALPRISRRSAATFPAPEQRPAVEQPQGGQHVHLHLPAGMSAEELGALLKRLPRGE